jgi:hypothetical protein
MYCLVLADLFAEAAGREFALGKHRVALVHERGDDLEARVQDARALRTLAIGQVGAFCLRCVP